MEAGTALSTIVRSSGRFWCVLSSKWVEDLAPVEVWIRFSGTTVTKPNLLESRPQTSEYFQSCLAVFPNTNQHNNGIQYFGNGSKEREHGSYRSEAEVLADERRSPDEIHKRRQMTQEEGNRGLNIKVSSMCRITWMRRVTNICCCRLTSLKWTLSFCIFLMLIQMLIPVNPMITTDVKTSR